MKIQLPSDLYSHQDFKEVILEVRSYARWVNQSAVKKKVAKASSSEPPSLSAAASSLIKQWQPEDQKSTPSFDELITALEDYAAMAPKMTITLGALPPASLKKKLVSWCRKNIDPRILVEFHYNSTMLGGMVVRYGSHIHDWSFKRQIQASINKFPEILRHV